MKTFLVLTLCGLSVWAQQSQTLPAHVGAGAQTLTDVFNLPVERLGPDDLIGLSVYDEPELIRTIRVNSEGKLRLPMIQRQIQAAGLYPGELEKEITRALIEEHLLVDPIVTVSVVEYRSRPITVIGAVKNPLIFQATGKVTLLDAISQAGGLTPEAGSEILVTSANTSADSSSPPLIIRVTVHGLIDGADPGLNIPLAGGEEIRVPEAGRIFVLGSVKKPGAFLITGGSESSVMKALSLSEGLDSFSSRTAYIYRVEGSHVGKSEIAVPLRKIMDRKSPDVTLLANDILYIPNATGKKASLKALESSVIVGTGLGAALIYTMH
jgi:polysaccharide export outer membrane protein